VKDRSYLFVGRKLTPRDFVKGSTNSCPLMVRKPVYFRLLFLHCQQNAHSDFLT